MSNEKDYVIEIMNKWYSSLKKNDSTVEPKAATILGGILSEYDLIISSNSNSPVLAESILGSSNLIVFPSKTM